MKYFVVFILLLSASVGFAQLQVKPLKGSESKSSKSNARLQSTTITLPFWDDFSTSTGAIDTTWWLPGSQVQVIAKPGIGIDPPSLGVATFDGVDATGTPYLASATDGNVDSLLSQPIDMTQVPANLRNTVYLSFFYQSKGLGEAPEEQDSLILYLKDIDGTWNKVWPANSNDNYTTNPTVFTEKFIHVSDAKYFHDQFQFMFRAKGRQNGWYDNWLLDYVYMDKRRSPTDNSYLDRAFTQPPTSLFDNYTAIPFDDFVETIDKSTLFQSTSTKLRNLESDIQPIEYSVNIYDTLNHTLVQSTTVDQELLLFSKALEEINSPAIDPGLLDQSADSLYLMLEYYVNSGDKFLVDSIYNNDQDTAFYSNVNLRINDTTRAYFNIHDYYAYDDGTAEYGAGINQPQGKIAYQYSVIVGKYLDRIDMYFPNVDGNQAGSPLDLFVLNDFEGNENSLQTQSNIAIKHTGINEFVSYNITPAIYVTDTFYIGFTNLSSSDNWVGVGLDKNTDSFDKMFVNLDGNWVPNTNVHGSLMMRPHFTDEAPVTGIDDKQLVSIDVYPNPSFGIIHVADEVVSYRLTDLLGKEIPSSLNSAREIRYEVGAPQILILMLETRQGIFSKRIAANPAN